MCGALRRATRFRARALNVSYALQLGEGWAATAGDTAGQSQFDSPGDPRFDGFVFELPLEFALRAATLAGWPLLRLSFHTLDEKLQQQLVGQCELPLPLAPGRRELVLPCWRVGRELVQRAEGPGPPQPGGSVVAEGPRSCLVTESAGDVHLQLQVVAHGLLERGVAV